MFSGNFGGFSLALGNGEPTRIAAPWGRSH
jgi:hypothetical protein